MPLQNLQGELLGTFPRLPALHAVQLINRAWGRLRDYRMWSWNLVSDAPIVAPGIVTAGSVAVSYGSTTAVVDAAAADAINLDNAVIPVAGPVGQGRQIRIGATSNAVYAASGPLYSILNWDGISQLTLDRPYGEATALTAPYQIYKVYYTAPAFPFALTGAPDAQAIRFITLTNKASGYSTRGGNLHVQQYQLNAVDPQRGATGDPYMIANYGHDSSGQAIYELYPSPVARSTYYVTYYTRWPDLSTTVDLPQVPYALAACVMDLARAFACQWAAANAATYPELQQTNWVAAQQMYKQDHREGLQMCIKQDDEIMPQVPFRVSRGVPLPFGGQFLQSHDVTSFLLH